MVCETEYELLDQIGRGSYGKVYKARHDSGEVHAIKIVELEADEDDLDSIQQEIQMLQAFNCSQLTRYYGSFVVGSALWIVMEYLEGGSLQGLIKSSANNLDEATTQWILKEVLKALAYLHAERKIHRDVKAGNILVAADASVRLADFGESVQLTHSIAKRQTFAGSPYWMAPEVIMAQDTYNSKADIWSLGITAIEMIKGTPPYSDLHPMKAVLFIPTNPPPTLPKNRHFSKHFHSFLEQCLQRDPRLRPSAQDLLKHPFMKNAKPTDALPKLLESRRAAELMKSLFGGSRSTSTATEAAPKSSHLPAAAAAAIAAAKLAESNADTVKAKLNQDGTRKQTGSSDTNPLTPALVEWDFDDGVDAAPPSVPLEVVAGIQRPETPNIGDFGTQGASGWGDYNSPQPLEEAGARRGGDAVEPFPNSEEAVTPTARGDGGVWAVNALASGRSAWEDEKGSRRGHGRGGSWERAGEAGEGRRRREESPRRGRLTKAGQLLGVADIESAASIQGSMVELSRRARAEEIHRQGLGPGGSTKSPQPTPAGLSRDEFTARNNAKGVPVPANSSSTEKHAKISPSKAPASLVAGLRSAASPPGASPDLRERKAVAAGGWARGSAGGGRMESFVGRLLRSAARESTSSWSTSPTNASRTSKSGWRSPRRRFGSRDSNSDSNSPGLEATAAAAIAAAGEAALANFSPLPSPSPSPTRTTAPVGASEEPSFSLDAFVKSIGTDAPVSAASSRRTSVVGDGERMMEERDGDHHRQEEEQQEEEEEEEEDGKKLRGVDGNCWASPLSGDPGEQRDESSPVVSATSNVAVFHSEDGGGGGIGREVDFERSYSLDEEEREGEGDTVMQVGAGRAQENEAAAMEPFGVATVPEDVGGIQEYGDASGEGVPLLEEEEAFVLRDEEDRDDDGDLVRVDGDAPVAIPADGDDDDDDIVVGASEDGRAAQCEEAQGDVLTPAFHRHLTPALCELWATTEEGSAQRQAVQDVAMAMERLDGCSGGGLTLSFVEAVAKSWQPGGSQAGDNSDFVPAPPPQT